MLPGQSDLPWTCTQYYVCFQLDDLTNGAIVIAYTDGEPATVHTMNKKQCERYWKLWVKRVYSYWVMKYDEKMSVDNPS